MLLTPPITSSDWNDWYLLERNTRIAYCQNVNRTEYYFDAQGSDSAGDGSILNPWQSVSKAQEIIANSNGFVAVLFQNGDVFQSLTGLETQLKPFVKIGNYGDSNLGKPKITTFRPLNPVLWENGNGYQYQVVNETITWVKSSTGPLIRGNDTNFIANTPESWYFNASTNVLFVNSSDLNSLEYTVPTEAGIIIRGDGNLVENIVSEGWGIKTTTPSQQHGIEIRTTANRQAVVLNSESYYGSSHVMVHLGTDNEFGPNAYGGIATFVNCKAGWANYNPNGGESIFNTFSRFGGQDVIFDNVIVSHGTLPSQEWNYNNGFRGLGIYGHTSGPNYPAGRVIINGANIENVMIGVSFNDAPPTQHINDARVIIANSQFTCETNALSNPYITISKCIFDLWPQPNSFSLANYAQDGWLINSIVSINLSRHLWQFALFNNPPSTTTSPEFYHNLFMITNPHPTSVFNLDYDNPTQAPNGKFENNVVVHWNQPNFVWQMGGMNYNYIVNSINGSNLYLDCNSPLQCLAGPSNINTSINVNTLINRKTIGPTEILQCADINFDYQIDFFDYLDFVTLYSGNFSEADFNADTTIDFFDYLDFISYWSASC